MASIISEEKDPGTCGFCKKSFEYLSTFIRHVTHSKLCLEYHDPDFIEKIKRQSRLNSRKRWFANAWERGLKEKRKAIRENIKSVNNVAKKKYYVSVNERKSFAGKSF